MLHAIDNTHTLDVIACHLILCVRKALHFKEGRDGQTWKDHVHNCAPCHLPDVDGQIDPSLVYLLVYDVWVVHKNCHYVGL